MGLWILSGKVHGVANKKLFEKRPGPMEPEAYLRNMALLGLEPHQCMMVAAHNGDLLAAQAVGFHTAFVLRALEYGPTQATNLEADPSVDVTATDLGDLADKLL